MIITRDDYMGGRKSFAEYYGQFANDKVQELVMAEFSMEELNSSDDPYLNHLNLARWNGLARILQNNFTYFVEDELRPHVVRSQASMVCILKAAASRVRAERNSK